MYLLGVNLRIVDNVKEGGQPDWVLTVRLHDRTSGKHSETDASQSDKTSPSG